MRLFIITIAFMLVLVGCTGGSQSGDTSEPTSGTTNAATNSSEASGDEPAIDDFVPGFFGLFDNSEEQYLQAERSIQDSIAACMAEQGFDYIPYVPSTDRGGFSGSDTDEEVAERWGFGITTDLLTDLVVEEEKMATAKEDERAKDPNAAIVDALTPEERQEYDIALNGSGPRPGNPVTDEGSEPSDSPSGPPPEGGPGSATAPSDLSGCRPIAQAEVYQDAAWAGFDDKFGAAINDIQRTIESDPRLTKLQEQWSSCMAQKGYDFTDESDVRNFLVQRLADIGAITDLITNADGDIKSWMRVDIKPGSAIETAVKQLASEEIAMAKVSVACSGDRDEVYEQVSKEAEQRFIEENLTNLEQFKKDHSS